MQINKTIFSFRSIFCNSYYPRLLTLLFIIILSSLLLTVDAQISNANRSGFTWITTENIGDNSYGSGYTLYSAAWPTFENYPGASNFQMGLAGCWLTTQRTGNEPDQFYTTIEGGLGWWRDTRFGKKVPKFIMGGVSYNFFAWANGPGAGRSNNLSNGQRDWSTPGGKYGVAQLSNRLIWAPDGLNMAQGLNGELLGYGYTPLPITDPLTQTAGTDIETGNQCWTLFLNSTNFKGPATFFLPTFWTKPVLENPSLEGMFLDSRPSNPNVGFGLEHADSPAIISMDSDGVPYAKTERLQMPACGENNSILMNRVSVYSQTAVWNAMESWFNGGEIAKPELSQSGTNEVFFVNNGGSLVGEISENGQNGLNHEIDLSFMDNVQQTANTMGYTYNLNEVQRKNDNFLLPEYYKLDADNKWRPVKEINVPTSTNLTNTPVPTSPRSEITYLTPLEPDCAWQDPNGPWNSPGPTAGPFQAELGDGSTLTYYWYRFIDQPAIIHANLPNEVRENMQERVELIHANWSHTDDYLAPPTVGSLATLDPEAIVQPPAGLEIGYVPIVTRQEKTKSKLRVFVLAGQSNMQGQGTIDDPENDPGSLKDVIENDVEGNWSNVGTMENWTTLDKTFLYFENDNNTIKTNVTVGQGANSNLIGPELMFAHQLDKYYDDPVLIIKTAWGGKSLAEDFRPPSAGGTTGAFYNSMIDKVKFVTENLESEFPDIEESQFEISGFAWFQGWNDGASDNFLNEYESNLNHLVNDVRTDLDIADLPFVIASSGHGGYFTSNDGWVQNMQNIVSVAQQNVGCNDESYNGKVGFVDTKQYYKDLEESPLDAIHHFNNNALSFLNIGKAIGDRMILAINDMAFCKVACAEELISPDLVSIGNRVWNDYNRDGFNDLNEPGIPGVSVVLWRDSDGDDVPDSGGFGGVQITDEGGYYRFGGLLPGNYVTFVWQVNNWGPGEPLNGFVSTNAYEPNANNDVDFDNNGSGNPFSDIFSGIVTLTVDGEPLNDGDPEDGLINYDPAGNNSVDFGFYNPNVDDVDGDGFLMADDCDDFNPNINPNQSEVPYNGLDDDCDASTLDDDLDQDGFLLTDDCDDNNPNINPDQTEDPYNGLDDDCNASTLDDDLDQDGFLLADDCDDNNPNINPDQTELPYNGIDDDCNSATLDDDLDQDGFLLTDDCDDNNPNINPDQTEVTYNGIDDDCNSSTLDDDLDQDGFLLADDCDDNNPNINPDQTELPYNGIDDDCNSATLDDDLDQDGFLLADDCDDNNPNINPNQTENPYNGIDDDCNSATLDDDLDQDGFLLADDCDDNNPNINPNQTENPYNGIDDDCNASTLDDDLDQDGFLLADDCDDNNPNINPNQTENPYNGIDDDCNASTLDDDLDQDGFLLADDCDDNNPNINPDQIEVTYNGIDDDCNSATLDDDLDQDGFLLADDCDDNNPNINPDQTELPYNGIDDDCNASTLDDDLDQDGFLLTDDCDDNNPNINPDQTELPYNGIDDDCNSATLDDDLDQDGFLLADDCDDNNPNINPNQTENPYNGIDDDCNSATLDDDLDQDGFLLADDCDDNNPNINPNAEEIPNNGIDEDCDGTDLISSTHEIGKTTINIYPNPVTSLINIDVDRELNFSVTLYDLKGRLVKKTNNVNQLEIDSITNGIYLIEIKDLNTGQKLVERIMIIK